MIFSPHIGFHISFKTPPIPELMVQEFGRPKPGGFEKPRGRG